MNFIINAPIRGLLWLQRSDKLRSISSHGAHFRKESWYLKLFVSRTRTLSEDSTRFLVRPIRVKKIPSIREN